MTEEKAKRISNINDWKKRFDELWEELREEPEFGRYNKKPILDFIQKELDRQREEVIDEFAKKLLDTPDLGYSDIKYHQSSLKSNK